MLAKSQLQASGSGEPAGGYLVWVGAGLLAVDGGSSKLVVDIAPRRPAAGSLVPATVAALATVWAVAAAASVAAFVVVVAR